MSTTGGMALVVLSITVNAHVITVVKGAERMFTVTKKAIDVIGVESDAFKVNRY